MMFFYVKYSHEKRRYLDKIAQAIAKLYRKKTDVFFKFPAVLTISNLKTRNTSERK